MGGMCPRELDQAPVAINDFICLTREGRLELVGIVCSSLELHWICP